MTEPIFRVQPKMSKLQPARVQRADRAAARFVPRLNGAGTPQRGVRYLLQQLRDAPMIH